MSRDHASELAVRFPNLSQWVFGGGWVEIGQDRRDAPFARALDEGGQVWEGKRSDRSLEEALTALDRGISAWLKKNG